MTSVIIRSFDEDALFKNPIDGEITVNMNGAYELEDFSIENTFYNVVIDDNGKAGSELQIYDTNTNIEVPSGITTGGYYSALEMVTALNANLPLNLNVTWDAITYKFTIHPDLLNALGIVFRNDSRFNQILGFPIDVIHSTVPVASEFTPSLHKKQVIIIEFFNNSDPINRSSLGTVCIPLSDRYGGLIQLKNPLRIYADNLTNISWVISCPDQEIEHCGHFTAIFREIIE